MTNIDEMLKYLAIRIAKLRTAKNLSARDMSLLMDKKNPIPIILKMESLSHL